MDRHLIHRILLLSWGFLLIPTPSISLAATQAEATLDSESARASLGSRDPLGKARVSIAVSENEEVRQRLAAMRKLWRSPSREATVGYWGQPELDRLRGILGGIRFESEPPGPATLPQRRGELIALTLQQSIEMALKNNLGIRIAALARDSARYGIPLASAKFHPTLGSGLTALGNNTVFEKSPNARIRDQQFAPFIRQELPTGGSLTLSANLTRETTRFSAVSGEAASALTNFGAAATLSAVQPLLRGGRIYVATKPIRDAEFDLRVADANLRAAVLGVTAQSKAAYYNVLLAEKVIEATEVAIQRDKALIEASQDLFNARLVTKRDVFSAELIFAQDSARIVSARADREAVRNALLDVLGLPIGTDVVLLDKEVRFEPVPVEMEGWIAAALKNRPEMLAVDEQLAKSALNIKVALNGLLPQLDVVGSYGRAHTGSTLGSSLDLHGGDVWSAGLVFSVPLGNVAARSALAQAEIAHSRLLEARSQTRRQIELEVRAAVIKLEKSVERMKALTAAIEQAKGKLEVGKVQFALGQATNLDITDAQQALLSAETDLLTAIVDYTVGVAELEARIAGPLQ